MQHLMVTTKSHKTHLNANEERVKYDSIILRLIALIFNQTRLICDLPIEEYKMAY